MGDICIGMTCVVERRFSCSSTAEHRWERTVTKLTPKRAYFGDRHWFDLDDPTREVKPRYLDYRTCVVELRPATPPSSTPTTTETKP